MFFDPDMISLVLLSIISSTELFLLSNLIVTY